MIFPPFIHSHTSIKDIKNQSNKHIIQETKANIYNIYCVGYVLYQRQNSVYLRKSWYHLLAMFK